MVAVRSRMWLVNESQFLNRGNQSEMSKRQIQCYLCGLFHFCAVYVAGFDLLVVNLLW